jgi:iron-sulfur cluster repair protein YtfE (RIC family)
MVDRSPSTRHYAQPLVALTCPRPTRLTSFTVHAAERRRVGFAFDARDKRADFIAAYPELDVVCERLGFGWDLTVVDWSPNPSWVLNELARAAVPQTHVHNDDLRSATIPEIVDHLLKVHHQPMRWEFNRLSLLIALLVDAHPHQRDIRALASGFQLLKDSLLVHLLQEELEAFPLCLEVEELQHSAGTSGTVIDADPLHFMAAGHLESSDDFARLRDLAHRAGLSNDPDANLVVQGLTAMHTDLVQHTMVENEILLPAAMFSCELLARHRPRTQTTKPPRNE